MSTQNQKQGTIAPINASITEWLRKIKFKQLDKFYQEDSTKRDRLEILKQEIGLPYVEAIKLRGIDVMQDNKILSQAIHLAKNNLFLVKLLPQKSGLKKIRTRGINFIDGIKWIKNQAVDLNSYKIEFVPCDDDAKLASVFCINEKGIWGEIIHGSIWEFSLGNYSKKPIIFFFDFQKWHFSNPDKLAQNFIKKMIKKLLIPTHKQQKITKKIKVKISLNGYLNGYFECVDLPRGSFFVDYNRLLLRILNKVTLSITNTVSSLNGICIGPGQATGKPVIITNPLKPTKIHPTNIIVCPSPSLDYLPFIQKAAGVIAEQGSVLSHAAIICRELKKPFVSYVTDATQILKNVKQVQVDATNGKIRIIE